MGDRVSISFSNLLEGWTERNESPVLFCHWGGMDFVNLAYQYARGLKARAKKNGPCYPLDRLEPQTVMVDFIREITAGLEVVNSNLYLGRTEEDGDNSDNGHHEIKLDEV